MRYSKLRLTVAIIGCLSCSGTAVTPPTQYGSINGSVTSSLGGGISGAIVVITPTDMTALAPDTTKASGTFSASSVPIANGSGTITVSNVPSSCSVPKPSTYNISTGRPASINVIVPCVTPVDSVAGTISESTGGNAANVNVTVTPTGDTARTTTTSNAGNWAVSPINPNGGTITLSNVPNNCVTPAPVTYTSKAGGGTQIVNITLTCSSSGVAVVTGIITSSQGNSAIAGLGVVVTPHGGTALPAVPSNASGAFTATGVPIADGTGSITLTNLPSNCPTPAATTYSALANGSTKTVNIVVPCTPPVGTIIGTISASSGGTLATVGVIATPLNGTPTPSVLTNSSGQYSLGNVPVAGTGQGSISLTNLPPGCQPLTTAPTYTGLTNNGTITVNVTVTCTTQIGSVQGFVTDLGKPALGFYAVITPTGGQPVNSLVAFPTGGIYGAQVPVANGTGSVALVNLPVNCATPAPQKYSGLTNGGTVTVDFTPTCTNTGGVDVIVSTLLPPSYPLPSNIGNVVIHSGTYQSPVLTQTGIVAGLQAGMDTVIGNPSLSPDQTVATVYINDSTTHKMDTIVVAKLDSTIVYYDPVFVTGGLWIADSASQLLSDFSGPQLRQGGSLTPSNLEAPTTTAAPTGLVVNNSTWTVWVALGSANQIVRYNFISGEATPNTTYSAGLSGPQGLAYDATGNLWVANANNNTIVALTSGGAVNTTVSSTALSTPTGVAFDANNNLWVTNPGNNTVVEFTASQLAGGGSVTPAVVISGSSLSTPTAIAFDASGNMFVANTGAGTIAEYSSSQRSASGSPTPNATIRAASGMTTPHGLAFDLGGNLWVVDVASHSLFGFSSGQIAAGGTLTPISTVTSTGGSLQAGVAIAFDPHATNLPLH